MQARGAGEDTGRGWRLRRRRGAHALGVLALLLLVGCGPSTAPAAPPSRATPARASESGASEAPRTPAPPAPIKLTINSGGVSGGQAGLWTAYEAGLFREQGLDAELVYIPATSRALQAMVAGEVQLSSLDPGASILASLGGVDTVLLLAATNRLFFSVMSQPSIQQPQALRSKTIAITRLGSSTHTAAQVALQSWGLAPDRDVMLLQLQEVPAILAALQAGQVEAGVLSPPTSSRARLAGFHELTNLATQGPEYPSVTFGGLRPWIAANEEAVRRFTRAYVLGVQRFKTDKALGIEVYRKYFQIDDADVLEDTYAQFSSYLPNPPYVSEAGIARLLEDLAGEEPRLLGRQPAEWIDARYVRELEASGFIRQVVGAER